MSGVLSNGDQRDRAAFYQAVGLLGQYDVTTNQVTLTVNPRGVMVRVGGGT
jgi:hypothetical protein